MGIKVYLMGCIIIAPIVIGLMSDSVVIIALSLFYGLALIVSPRHSQKARKFWRKWHRENFRVINSLK